MRPRCDFVCFAGIGGAGSEYNDWQNDYWDWQSNHTSSAGGMTGDMVWDWTGWGSEVGTYNDGTTTAGFTNTLWIFDKIGNEHCNVSDPVNTNWDNSYLDSGDDYDKGSENDTYTRTADTIWHVQTGGKAIPGRQSLWQFSGSATEIRDKRAVPQFAGANSRAIPPQHVFILGHAMDTNGIYWLTLPDGADYDATPEVAGKDFYTFSVGAQKYHLYIGLSTSTTNANLDTDTPEVCVGQSVIMGADWEGGSGPSADADIRWHLPEKYVNQQTNYSTNCTTYVRPAVSEVTNSETAGFLSASGQNQPAESE